MDIKDLFIKRRTSHEFFQKKVPYQLIINAVSAANLAPCHKLTFPWMFRDVTDETRIKIIELYKHIKYKMVTDLSFEQNQNIKNKFINPSNLIVVSQKIDKKNNEITIKEDYAACSCAIQNLSLYLANENISTKWSTSFLIKQEATYEILKIDQKLEEIIGFLWIGYGKLPNEISRPKLENILQKV